MRMRMIINMQFKKRTTLGLELDPQSEQSVCDPTEKYAAAKKL